MDYNATLKLPKTDFPMRAGLPAREPVMLEAWNENKLYERLMEKNAGKKPFILHDGPPFSNGDIHMGHALNKILKDFVLRYKNMSGFYAPYVPGWDNHGMPIESAIIKKQKLNRHKMDAADFRDACRDFAWDFVVRQREQFRRLGILGNWENPYTTMDPSFEAAEIEIFGEMYEKGLIYRGLKPVYWCPGDNTALAEAEIEYQNDPCDSIYVRFPLVEDLGKLGQYGALSDISFVIWTTTTWSLPGNLAISLNPRFDYALVKANGHIYILADTLKEAVAKTAGWESFEVLGTLKGKEFEYMKARHPFLDRESLIILGEHVTAEAGTGCVHTAPGHGADDYFVCKKYNIPVIVPVDDAGRMNELAGEKYNGMKTDEANKAISADMKESGMLLCSESIEHSYPHCWRCGKAIVYRATEQWFCSVDAIMEKAVEEALKVTWYPSWGKERMEGMLRERSDWCISRQRNWGMPIPVFYCGSCEKPVITPETTKNIADIFRKEGSNAWFRREAEELLPNGFVCPHCGKGIFKKETSTLDCWFDSGSTHAAVLRTRDDQLWPADLYLEGGDQYRGWFQSSLLTAVATKDCTAPYREVVTNGWVVDGEGRKMSKSLGNGVEPKDVISQYGADVMRLWVGSTDYRTDVRVSPKILKQQSEIYLKIRNTCRFILGNLADYDPNIGEYELSELDKWILFKLNELVKKCRKAYDTYEYHIVCHALHNFCVIDLSNFYLDIIKDRLYCDKENSSKRRGTQAAMHKILSVLIRLAAPILAYTSEEVWGFMKHGPAEDGESVLFNPFPAEETNLTADTEKWTGLMSLRDEVNKALEKARAEKVIGKSLEAVVTIGATGAEYEFLKANETELPELFIVSKVILQEGEGIGIAFAPGEKCSRCWGYFENLGENPKHETLCLRCADAVE